MTTTELITTPCIISCVQGKHDTQFLHFHTSNDLIKINNFGPFTHITGRADSPRILVKQCELLAISKKFNVFVSLATLLAI